MAKDIIVRIRAEGQEKFIKDMKAAGHSVEEVGEETKRTEKKMSSSLKSISKLIGAAFATQQLIKFGKELARTAVDIDATNKKLQIVFGDSAKAIEGFAKRSATSLGLTVNEYKRAAAAAGDLLIPIGFQRREAAKLSGDLVKLSGALSAWTGGQLNASQVSEILTKALLGEREQLKQLGIQISEADVKAKLLEKGQAKLTGTALAQAKAMASLELITAKSADAQAAFADDTETLAESQLKLTAELNTFKEEIAEGLIPVLADLFTALNKNVTPALRRFFNALKEDAVAADRFREFISEKTIEELEVLRSALDKDVKRGEKDLETRKRHLNEMSKIDYIRRKNLKERIKLNEEVLKSDKSDLAQVEQLIAARKREAEEDKNKNDNIEKQIRTLTLLNEQLKEQRKIILTTDSLSQEYFNAVFEVERLKTEIKAITDATDLAVLKAKAFRDGFKELGVELVAGKVKEIADQIEDAAEGIETITVEIDPIIKRDPEDALELPDIDFSDVKDKTNDFWDDFDERTQESIEKAQQARIAAAQTAVGIAANTGNEIFNIASGFIDAELAALEEKNRKGEISDKEYEERKSALKNKAARTQRQADIVQAITNTAVAITAQLGQGPLGFILAALAAAQGAAQIALISSQPVPQFAKGTKGNKKAPAGFKWVGEEGPELIYDQGGYDVLTAGDSEQLANILASYSIPVQFTRTEDDLHKPLKTIKDITSNNAFGKIDWNPLLNASDIQRRSLGKKLDILHYDLMRVNHGLTRRKTAN